jgi:hypothetical protein
MDSARSPQACRRAHLHQGQASPGWRFAPSLTKAARGGLRSCARDGRMPPAGSNKRMDGSRVLHSGQSFGSASAKRPSVPATTFHAAARSGRQGRREAPGRRPLPLTVASTAAHWSGSGGARLPTGDNEEPQKKEPSTASRSRWCRTGRRAAPSARSPGCRRSSAACTRRRGRRRPRPPPAPPAGHRAGRPPLNRARRR